MRRLLLVALLAATASAQDSPFDLYRARPGDGPAAVAPSPTTRARHTSYVPTDRPHVATVLDGRTGESLATTTRIPRVAD